jgi:uncharacterized membrane protein YkvA (DUF1232 family)
MKNQRQKSIKKKEAEGMLKFRVGDLRSYMKRTHSSAEVISRKIPLSNMTIRRLLQLSDTKPIPEKYQLHIASLLQAESATATTTAQTAAQTFVSGTDMITQLIHDGKSAADSEKIKIDLEKKVKKESLPETILSSIKTLKDYAFSKASSRKKWIALGALIYFINPFDLIPDALPIVGYLDDIGVMTLAIQQILSLSSTPDSGKS